MPNSTSSKTEYYIERQRKHSIDGQFVVINDGDEVVETVSKQWNDPESRPKPDDLLFNQTSQPRQSTAVTENMITGKFWPNKWQRCYESGHYPTCWSNDLHQYVQAMPRYDEQGFVDYRDDWPDWATDLRLKVKDEAINLGATVAEYKQSANMFGSAAKGVVNAWRAFRRGKFLKRKTTCDISAAHLIYDYGVAPLMSDMFDSYEALRYRLERPVYRRYFFKQRKDPYHSTASSTGPYYTTEYDINAEMDQYISAHVRLDLDKASMFTLGNPLEIAWELVPYSFVVDWFIPIGDTLIALDALKAVDDIMVSVVRKRYWYQEARPVGEDAWGNPIGCLQPGTYTYHDHQRIATSTVPLPSIPKFNLNATTSKLLNAVSLLHVARGCKGRAPRFSRADFHA